MRGSFSPHVYGAILH